MTTQPIKILVLGGGYSGVMAALRHGDLTTAALGAKLRAYGKNPFRVVVVGSGATGLEANVPSVRL